MARASLTQWLALSHRRENPPAVRPVTSGLNDPPQQTFGLKRQFVGAHLGRPGLIPQAKNSMQAALAAYRVSKVDFQTLISAFVDLLNLQEEYYRELADHQIAVAKLEQIIGEVK